MPKKDKWDFIAKAVQEARADETADSRTSSLMSTTHVKTGARPKASDPAAPAAGGRVTRHSK